MIELLQTHWPILALLASITTFYLLLRNHATPVSSLEEIVGNGKPTIIEIFSNT